MRNSTDLKQKFLADAREAGYEVEFFNLRNLGDPAIGNDFILRDPLSADEFIGRLSGRRKSNFTDDILVTLDRLERFNKQVINIGKKPIWVFEDLKNSHSQSIDFEILYVDEMLEKMRNQRKKTFSYQFKN